MNHIEKSWNTFDAQCIAPEAGQHQRREMKTAFYAGCYFLFHYLLAALDPGSMDATEPDVTLMDEIHEELKRFETSAQARPRGHN